MPALSQEQAIAGFRQKHGDRYGYKKVRYSRTNIKVEIVCREHGSFFQTPNSHKGGAGCPRCSDTKRGGSQRLTLEKAIANMKAKHGDLYDYSRVTEYKNAHTKLDIVCRKHGPFKQSYHKHSSQKRGCPVCANNIPLTQETAIKRLKAANPEYDYSKVVYVNNHSHITVICKKHGEFRSNYKLQLKGVKCAKCAGNARLSTEECVRGFRKVWGTEYDYSKVNYVNTSQHVIVGCSRHGDFPVAPNNHRAGNGCPICKSSKGERFISQVLQKHGIKFEQQKMFPGVVYRQSLLCDFFLPDYNLVVEYNGRQHYEPVDVFGGAKEFRDIKRRDRAKARCLKKKGIRLLVIPYTETDIEGTLLDSLMVRQLSLLELMAA